MNVIWWVRRDLRTGDNAALARALQDAASVTPVFVIDGRLLERAAPARRRFLAESLRELDARLRERGGRLIVRRGRPERVLLELARETQAAAVYHHRDYTPYARTRDERVRRALTEAGLRVVAVADNYLSEPEQVLKPDGSPFRVYTAYRRRLEPLLGDLGTYMTGRNLNTPPGLASDPLPVAGDSPAPVAAGESAGRELLAQFIASGRLGGYASERNTLGQPATSYLSPHLHFGTISVRELVRAARSQPGAGRGAQTWVDEIAWRDFYMQILWYYPHAARGAFRPEYDRVAWQNDPALLDAWRAGQTGYPVVDAAMRELAATGWMHNRARMIVAAFLTKDLLCDWRLGERHFMQHLVDGDVASNNGGWQWSASTGTDAQPYFRVFNPVLQGRKFDAAGAYVRRWVPELEAVPDKQLHSPWLMSADEQSRAGVRLGRDYPAPVVQHDVQRGLAITMYRTATGGALPGETR